MNFHPLNSISDAQLKFSVIVSRYNKTWIFVRHRERQTWELPGGRREQGEQILCTAHRELYEETGAQSYHLIPLEIYEMRLKSGKLGFGLICFAEIERLSVLPNSEIVEILGFESCPAVLTHPIAHKEIFSHTVNSLAKIELLFTKSKLNFHNPNANIKDTDLLTGVDYYLENDQFVLTPFFLKKRAFCCQSKCRHCPY